MVFLSKFLPLIFYPLGFSLLLLVLSLIVARRPKLRTILQVTALLILLVFSNRWVAQALTRSLEWRYLPQGELPRTQAIVVLGGGTEPAVPPRPQPEMNSAADRLFYAANLYRAGKAPQVILSGGNILWLENPADTPADDMQNLLVQLGVPPEAMVLEGESQNTEENARYTAQILRERGITDFLLVTSAIHMPRSMMLFEAEGLNPRPAPCDFSVTETSWNDLSANPMALAINLIPNTGSLSASTTALKEHFGILYTQLRLLRSP